MIEKEFNPAYKVIEEDMIADINNGFYKPGEPIKGQNYYAEKFGASRTTVRKAIQELVRKGVLESFQGKGTFVKKTRGAEEGDQAGNRRFKVIEIRNEKADKIIAGALEIEAGQPIVRIERVRMVNEQAENYQISYIAQNLIRDVDFTKEDMENGSIYYYLSNIGKLFPQYSDENIYAVECPEKVAEYFQVRRKSPVLLIHRITHSMDGIVMEYCLDYLGPDIHGLRIRR